MFDPSALIVAGVPLMALVFGLVEFIKTLFEMDGKKVTVMSAIVGLALAIPYQLYNVIPTTFGGWMEIVIIGVVVGLSTSGFYKFVAARTEKL